MRLETRHPLLAPIAMKIEVVFRERERLRAFQEENSWESLSDAQKWAATTTVATVVRNVYQGMEEVMKVICDNVDGHVPEGEAFHQNILDQLAAPRNGRRKAFLSQDLYDELHELKGFRHVFNHGYAINLKEVRVVENLRRVDQVLPLFVDAIHALDRDLCEEVDPQDRPSCH